MLRRKRLSFGPFISNLLRRTNARMQRMRVSAISVHGAAGWPGVCLEVTGNQLTAVCGPSNSGKSTMAGLVGHALFGKSEAWLAGSDAAGGRARCRRQRRAVSAAARARCATRRPADGCGARRCGGRSSHHAAAGGQPAAKHPGAAVRGEFPRVAKCWAACCPRNLPSAFNRFKADGGPQASRRAAELATRRDLLAQELETRIAGERRASGELGNAVARARSARARPATTSGDAGTTAAIGARNRWQKPTLGCGIADWN